MNDDLIDELADDLNERDGKPRRQTQDGLSQPQDFLLTLLLCGSAVLTVCVIKAFLIWVK